MQDVAIAQMMILMPILFHQFVVCCDLTLPFSIGSARLEPQPDTKKSVPGYYAHLWPTKNQIRMVPSESTQVMPYHAVEMRHMTKCAAVLLREIRLLPPNCQQFLMATLYVGRKAKALTLQPPEALHSYCQREQNNWGGKGQYFLTGLTSHIRSIRRCMLLFWC